MWRSKTDYGRWHNVPRTRLQICVMLCHASGPWMWTQCLAPWNCISGSFHTQSSLQSCSRVWLMRWVSPSQRRIHLCVRVCVKQSWLTSNVCQYIHTTFVSLNPIALPFASTLCTCSLSQFHENNLKIIGKDLFVMWLSSTVDLCVLPVTLELFIPSLVFENYVYCPLYSILFSEKICESLMKTIYRQSPKLSALRLATWSILG